MTNKTNIQDILIDKNIMLEYLKEEHKQFDIVEYQGVEQVVGDSFATVMYRTKIDIMESHNRDKYSIMVIDLNNFMKYNTRISRKRKLNKLLKDVNSY